MASPCPKYACVGRYILLRQPVEGILEQKLHDISSLSHPSYGKQLKRDKIEQLLHTRTEAIRSVLRWLSYSEIRPSGIHEDDELVHFIANISAAERMVNTSFRVHQNDVRPMDKVRTLSYSLPECLHQYVDMVQPTTRFDQIQAQCSDLLNVEHAGAAHSGLNATSSNPTITSSYTISLYNVTPQHQSSGRT